MALNIFAMVDLPDPLWPSRATNSPRRMERLTPSSTLCGSQPSSGSYAKTTSFAVMNSFSLIFCASFAYSCQMAVLPQGRTSPVAVTGSPISPDETRPPNFFPSNTPSRYSMTAGDKPVV